MCSVIQNIKAEGGAEGCAESRAELIEAMLRSGKSPDEIASFTGISLDEVKQVEGAMLVQA